MHWSATHCFITLFWKRLGNRPIQLFLKRDSKSRLGSIILPAVAYDWIFSVQIFAIHMAKFSKIKFTGRHPAGIYPTPFLSHILVYFSRHLLLLEIWIHPLNVAALFTTYRKSFIHWTACTQLTQQRNKYGSTVADDPHCFPSVFAGSPISRVLQHIRF